MSQLTNLLDAALEEDQHITFGEEATATSFRAHVYRRRRKWERTNQMLFELYEDIKIVKDKNNPQTLIFTTHERAFGPALSPYAVHPNTDSEALEDSFASNPPTGSGDPAADVLRQLGYAPKRYLNVPTERGEKLPPSSVPTEQGEPSPAEVPTYDTAYAKAAAGRPLTSEEEALLAEGPPPEPTPPDAD